MPNNSVDCVVQLDHRSVIAREWHIRLVYQILVTRRYVRYSPAGESTTVASNTEDSMVDESLSIVSTMAKDRRANDNGTSEEKTLANYWRTND